LALQPLLSEAVDYFREEPGFDHLLKLFMKKYESLGRIGGSVTIRHLSAEALHYIAAFYGVDPNDLKDQRISLKSFERQLQKTRFEGITLHALLEAYFGEPLRSRREKREQEREANHAFLQRCATQYPVLQNWIEYILHEPPDARFIYRLLDADLDQLSKMLSLVATALSSLPAAGQAERLPLFSQRVAGDPHAFDVQGTLGKLFLHALAVQQAVTTADSIHVPSTSEEINDCLQHVGLLRDDLHNFVTCAGLVAETDTGIHPVWREAVLTQTVWHAPVRELLKTRMIYPYKGRQVWMVENSGVCSAILDACPQAPVVCTHGQFKLAVWLLLDRLTQRDVILRYAGDFDPEGLGMAHKLKERFPSIRMWHMDKADYDRTNPQKPISHERLHQLDRITDPQLLPVAVAMKQRKVAGYQEALVGAYIQDIKEATK
jgi:uncharacterized protein (TIGR02679 family)